ncbi:MAG: coproporphyrinogen III oxidase family protein [Elusimicrobia bacterium]|nr:coproporphyrinogen III oxidase family protein [Elusimicrobiota bacterium]
MKLLSRLLGEPASPKADEAFRKRVDARAAAAFETFEFERLEGAGVELDPLEYHSFLQYPRRDFLPPLAETTGPALLGHAPPAIGGLYVHLPFCPYTCSFCPIPTTTSREDALVSRYMSALETELDAAQPWLAGSEIRSIYIGGGTPTLLETERLVRLAETLRERVSLAKDLEWTLEASPDTVDAAKAEAVVRAGVNRFSLGVQTMSQKLLDSFGRKHSIEQAARAIRILSNSGAEVVNVDLIFGFPGQTRDDIWRDVEMIAELRPDSISWNQLYQLNETPLRERMRRHPHEARAVYSTRAQVHEALSALGYEGRLGHGMYRRSSDRRRYTKNNVDPAGGLLVGFGVSSRGLINDFAYRNSTNLAEYFARVGKTGWGIASGARVTAEQRARRAVLFGLRQGGVPASVLEGEPRAVCDEMAEKLRACEREGLVERAADAYRLTDRALVFQDAVAGHVALGEDERQRFKEWHKPSLQ